MTVFGRDTLITCLQTMLLGPDLARAMPLARQIFSDENVAGPEPSDGAVADLDVDRAGQREHRVAAGRVVPGIRPRRLEPPNDDAAARDQLRALGLVALRLERRMDVLEVGRAVASCIDPNDGHVPSDLECGPAAGRPPGQYRISPAALPTRVRCNLSATDDQEVGLLCAADRAQHGTTSCSSRRREIAGAQPFRGAPPNAGRVAPCRCYPRPE